MVGSLTGHEEHIQAGLVGREFVCNLFRSLNHPEMEDLGLVQKMILVSCALAEFGSIVTWISGDDAVNQGAVHTAGLLEPVLEVLTEFPKFDVLVDALLQVLAVQEDKLAGEDDESLAHIALEILIAMIEQLDEFTRIGTSGCISELAGRVESDTGLGGVGDDETHLWLLGELQVFLKVAVGIDAAGYYVDEVDTVNGFAIEETLEIEMIEAILLIEHIYHSPVDGLDHDHGGVEIGLLVGFPDNPFDECAEEVSFAELNHFFGVGFRLRGGGAIKSFHIYYLYLLLKSKVTVGVVVADILHHLADEIHLGGGQAAFLDILSEHIAEDSAEVLVTGITDEGTTVGQHAHEAAEKTESGKGIELLAHAVLLIEEPPAGAELHLAGEGAVVEGICHSHHNLIVFGIEAVEDGLGELVFGCEAVEELVAGGSGGQVVDGIETGVGAYQVEHLGIVVADCADMELLCPTGLRIHNCHVVQEGAAEFVQFIFGRTLAEEHHLEYGFDFNLLIVSGIEGLESVVGKTASVGCEEVVPLLQGLDEIGVGIDLHTCSLSELGEVLLVGLGIFDRHGLVRPPGGNDLGAEGVLGNHLVPAEVVGGIVGSANDLHIEFADKRLAAEFLGSEFRVALLEDFTGGLGAQEFVDSENAAEFQMGPVVERVTESIRHGFSPLFEGLPGVVLSSGKIIFADTVGAHGTPFIMVAVMPVHQPELGDVAELDVLGNLLRHQMAMVIDDGHVLGMLVIKLPGSLALKHEIFVDK